MVEFVSRAAVVRSVEGAGGWHRARRKELTVQQSGEPVQATTAALRHERHARLGGILHVSHVPHLARDPAVDRPPGRPLPRLVGLASITVSVLAARRPGFSTQLGANGRSLG
jgi:hypothetical protein